jgi:phosphoglycerate dehydrogenase-like enzyme
MIHAPAVFPLIQSQCPEEFDLLFWETGHEEEMWEKLRQADFVISSHIQEEHLKSAPKLRLIQHPGVGYDGVDVAAAARAGIPVALTPEGTIVGMAEHTILLILALYKKLLIADSATRRGEWVSSTLRTECYFLQGKTLGIIGLGRIGQEVAKRAYSFGVKMAYYDVARPKPEVEAQLKVVYLPLDDLLRTSDIVTLHTPLTPQTHHLINDKKLALMKPSVILINTSRGRVVDEMSLIRALREGRIAGAGLDVFDPEPPKPDNPLFGMENVILTPHMATGTVDAMTEKARASFANMQRVLRGEEPLHVVKEIPAT